MVDDLSQEQILQVLKSNFLGRLGLHDGYKTYVVPTNYVFDGKFILAHAVEGAKIKIMRQFPAVCFEVEEVENANNWRSIMAWGWYQELTEERERFNAMKLFVDKQLHVKLPHPSREIRPATTNPGKTKMEKTVIYRIVLNEFKGKYEAG